METYTHYHYRTLAFYACFSITLLINVGVQYGLPKALYLLSAACLIYMVIDLIRYGKEILNILAQRRNSR